MTNWIFSLPTKAQLGWVGTMLTTKVVGVEGGREPACAEFPSTFVVSIVPTQPNCALEKHSFKIVLSTCGFEEMYHALIRWCQFKSRPLGSSMYFPCIHATSHKETGDGAIVQKIDGLFPTSMSVWLICPFELGSHIPRHKRFVKCLVWSAVTYFLYQIVNTLLQKAFQQIKVLFDKFFLRIRTVGWAKTYLKLIGLQKKFSTTVTSTPFSGTRSSSVQKPKLYIYPSHGVAFFMTKACFPPRIDCEPRGGRITWKFLDQQTQTWKSTFFQLLLLLSSVGREILCWWSEGNSGDVTRFYKHAFARHNSRKI